MVYTINPMEDARWPELCERHPQASVFHTTAWLTALQRTYGYAPVVYTTSPPRTDLANGVVFCSINSWLTGRRLVSLPFSDHCDPLGESRDQLNEIFATLRQILVKERLEYIEIRPLISDFLAGPSINESESFCIHTLDLRPGIETLFQKLQRDSIQRKVRRAEREDLRYEAGRSEPLLNHFYGLLLLTRRRHHLPPQPIEWFRNLMASMGERLTIRLAFHQRRPIAGILTLSHRETLVYKYGASDAAFHRLGGMPFLFWKTIREAKSCGIQQFDFGRSDTANQGLIRFKDQWGTRRSMLTYGRIAARPFRHAADGLALRLAKHVFGLMPDGLFTVAGRLLYKHIA
jgi:CelD/BcsL family acetyltransferase involved in cellulose biosynthesis